MQHRYKNKKTPETITTKELKQAITDIKKNIVKPIKGNYTITKNTLKRANRINTSIQSQLCKHGASIGLCRFNCKLPIDTISVK